LLEHARRGDPQRPLRWTSKSAAHLAGALREQGHEIVGRSLLRLLAGKGYTMQANRKTRQAQTIAIATRTKKKGRRSRGVGVTGTDSSWELRKVVGVGQRSRQVGTSDGIGRR
jgi:hypothetical protein